MLGLICGAIFRSDVLPGFGLAFIGSVIMSFVYVGVPHPVWIATDMLGVLITYPIGALIGWLYLRRRDRKAGELLRQFREKHGRNVLDD